MIRTGIGQDSHKFQKNKALVLGGTRIQEFDGLGGNSDGDAIMHALCNALAGCVGKGSIGTYSDKMCLEHGITDSREYLRTAYGFVKDKGYKVSNVSVAIEAKKPWLEKYFAAMKKEISGILDISAEEVGITVTSGEGLTSFGKGEGIQVIAIATIIKGE